MMWMKNCLMVIAAVIAVIATFAWMTGQASNESITLLAIGFLLLSAFYFVLTLLARLPFQRLRQTMASLLSIVLVLLGILYALPLIDAYRRGYDVSRSLLHPFVFAALGIGILALTQRK